MAFSADGAFLLSASRDRGLRQWPMMPSASDPETPLRRGAPPTPAQPRTRNLGVSPLAAGFIGGDSSGGIAVLSRDGLNGPTLTAIPPFGSSGSGGSGSDAPPLWEAKPAPLIGGRRPVALLCSSSSSSSSSAPAPAPPLIAVVSERTELETLSLRVERHLENTRKVAEWLQARDDVDNVRWASLDTSEYKALSDKYTPRGAGAVLTFELPGGKDAGRSFIDSLELFSHVANIGDVRSLAIHPSSTTHSQLSEQEQAATGVTPGLVRLAVGLEGIDDILADLDAGLRAAKS